jgi:DNA helicase II / ATP-dependent DNA helicase PcrA
VDVARWLEGLNPMQRRAATFGDGPLLVVAGAGSGKTKTLACRVAHLIDRGVPPERILLLTFTRRAAAEMIRRAGQMTDPVVAARVWGGTFHAVANRLLRRHAAAVGLPPQFSIVDQGDGADLMGMLRSELGFAGGKRRFPRKETLAAIYSRAINARTPLGEVLHKHFPWCADEIDGVREIFHAYTERKRGQGLLDYDDLLLFWHALARSPAGESVAGSFDHILVDEYQDTNALQAEILHAMRVGVPNITVVGDDAQAIYSFRAATIENILSFPDRFPGCEIVTLEHNYRSTQPILAVGNAVIAQATRRYAKELFSERTSELRPELVTCIDENAQTDAVCSTVLEHRERGVALRRQAVLFRAGHHSALLEIELARRNIPFVKYGGLKFLEAAHVKDLLALLRMIDNPHDELAWFRALQLVEGVGQTTARAVMDAVGVGRRSTSESPLTRLIDDAPRVPGAAASQFEELRRALAVCADDPPVPAQIDCLRSFYEPIVRRRYDSPDARLRDLEQLGALAAGTPSRERFVSELTLDPPVSTGDLAGPPLLDEDYLILSTIHSAKGGEWDAVHVIHAADGMIPSDMATGDPDEIEEELRLFYVALTRARVHLSVYVPLRFYHSGPSGDRHSYAQPSRFLTSEARALFDERPAFEEAERDAAPLVGVAGAGAEVDAFLGELFGT